MSALWVTGRRFSSQTFEMGQCEKNDIPHHLQKQKQRAYKLYLLCGYRIQRADDRL